MEQKTEKWELDPHIPDECYLVIGNGFDIEAGLPTRYTDFLKFLTLVDSRLNSSADENGNQCDAKIRELLDQYPPDASWHKVLKNYWVQHFMELGYQRNWIDFENEIARIIKIIEYNMDNAFHRVLTMDDNVYGYTEDFETTLDDYLSPYIENIEKGNDGKRYSKYDLTFRELRDMLKQELDQFIQAFEKYLLDYVEKIKLPEAGCIQNLLKQFLKAKKRFVICFNYTTTIERIFQVVDTNVEICYVHGRISKDKHKNQMVMGMNEYWSDEMLLDHAGFAAFRKYNQRIIKNTDNRYMDWFDSMKNNGLSRRTYVFGHSLGVADREIIEPLVTANGMQTSIYCYDNDHLNLAVANLSAIIGKKEMIKRTGGKKHTIEFRDQKELCVLTK